MAGSSSSDHQLKMRLPTEVYKRIKDKAKRENRPLNRIIVEELLRYPHLEKIAKLLEK